MIVAELQADESDTREEGEKKDEQEDDMSLMEKSSTPQIRKTLDSLFNFTFVTGNKEMQHIAIKTFRTDEMELIRTAQQSYIAYFVYVDVLNTCMFE